MRLVKVSAPAGKGGEVARLAVEVGIPQASLYQVEIYGKDGKRETKDVVDVNTSTPAAKAFIDALMVAPFFDVEHYSIDVRQPRTVVSKEGPRELTRPVVIPEIDVFEDLWQFSHVTSSFVGRMFIGALLLAYGMMKDNLLLMIAGLFFLPLLPLLLSMGFGLLTRQWRLAGQGGFALAVATALIVAGGAVVGYLTGPPLYYNSFSPMSTAALISAAVGVAAGFATSDDVGRRELIGLAATAQVALIPAWLGISLVIGFDPIEAVSSSPARRLLTFPVIVATIIVSSLVTYAALGMRGRGLGHFAAADHKRD